jgi:secreted trypsin-like serine protease
LSTLVLTIGHIGAASAVTDGTPDEGKNFPQVGLLIFDVDGAPAWRCSGTLLSPTVLLTAGHCTDGATGGRVWFEWDVQISVPSKFPPEPGYYPSDTATSVAFCGIHTHPQYGEGSFVLHDVGVVELCEPVSLPEGKAFGVLPTVNQLDALKTRRGKQDVTFTAVGYGLQKSFPDAASFQESRLRIRMIATPHLLQINVPGFTGGYSLLLSNNANTGGTCFGDSGGPNFLGTSNVIAAVTSYGINGNCAGTGGVFRMDRQDVLDFVNGILYPSD